MAGGNPTIDWKEDMPAVDYYIGRVVESVTESDEPDQPLWTINLEGGAQISNADEGHAKPEGLEGLGFSAVDESDPSVTRLYFGNQHNPMGTVVNFQSGALSFSDPHYTQGLPVQYGEENQAYEAPLPVSPDRTVDGPEEQPEAIEEPVDIEPVTSDDE